MYKVLMCGDRRWWARGPILMELKRLIKKHGKEKLIIIAGGAAGADIMCEITAKELSIHVARVDALWSTRYKSAGPQRNAAMLALGPDEVVAFHDNIRSSSGTKDMVRRAKLAGVPTRVVTAPKRRKA